MKTHIAPIFLIVLLSACSDLTVTKKMKPQSDEAVAREAEKLGVPADHVYRFADQEAFVSAAKNCDLPFGVLEVYNSQGLRLVEYEDAKSMVKDIGADSLQTLCRGNMDGLANALVNGDTLYPTDAVPTFAQCYSLKKLSGTEFQLPLQTDKKYIVLITWSNQWSYTRKRMKRWLEALRPIEKEVEWVLLNVDVK